ncbi:Retrovirus-related Pol polyprotein from type-1 retrotransposable element R1, partial [Stegodyphus mimosarum]
MDPCSFRPICLLSALGKIYEKIIVNRLKYHIHKNNFLSPKQYGFRSGCSTTHALQRIYDEVQHNRSQNLQTAFISVDLQSAFDTLWWPAIKQALREAQCPENIYQVFDSYLTDRQLLIASNNGIVTKTQTRGCPQGSCAGPLLWNLTFNKILEATWPDHTTIIAYADDAAILVKGRTRDEIEANGSEACAKFASLCEDLKLKISITKSSALLIPRPGTRPVRRPCIRLLGRNIKFTDTLKYLGLVWDSGLTWVPHLQQMRVKTSAIARMTRKFQGRNWGLNPHIQKSQHFQLTVPEQDCSLEGVTSPCSLKLCIEHSVLTLEPELK